jgi:hypothetical protein
MAYIKITNGQQEPYSIGKLHKENPNTSFPKLIPSSTLAAYGVYKIAVADLPSFDVATQVCSRNGVATDVDGQWTYEWTVRSKTSEEVAAYEGELASNARAKRNLLLDNTDWTQMPDSPLTDEAKASWASYRSSLRSLPEHSNWPNLEDADWPSEP